MSICEDTEKWQQNHQVELGKVIDRFRECDQNISPAEGRVDYDHSM